MALCRTNPHHTIIIARPTNWRGVGGGGDERQRESERGKEKEKM